MDSLPKTANTVILTEQAVGLSKMRKSFSFCFLAGNAQLKVQVLLKQNTLLKNYVVPKYTYSAWGSVRLERQSSSMSSSSSKISRMVSLKTLRSVSSSDKLKKEQAKGEGIPTGTSGTTWVCQRQKWRYRCSSAQTRRLILFYVTGNVFMVLFALLGVILSCQVLVKKLNCYF